MSRDPLEGVRPSDTAASSFSPAPPVSFEAAVWTQPVSSGRGSSAKVVVLVIVAAVIAVVAGAVAYFLTLPHAPLAPKAKPAGETVLKQGPAPADTPTPAPAATAK